MNPRRCVACRKSEVIDRLTRVVRLPDGTVVVDEKHKEQGRGAYLCYDPRCFVLARKKGLLSKALGVPVPDELFDELAKTRALPELAEDADLGSLLGIARRAGDLVIGQDRVLEALKLNTNYLVCFSSDCPDKLKEKIQTLTAECHQLTYNRYELGTWLGLNQTVTFALATSSGFVRKVSELLPRGGIELEKTTDL